MGTKSHKSRTGALSKGAEEGKELVRNEAEGRARRRCWTRQVVGARKDCVAVEELCRHRKPPKSGARGGGGAITQPRCGASSACRQGGEAVTYRRQSLCQPSSRAGSLCRERTIQNARERLSPRKGESRSNCQRVRRPPAPPATRPGGAGSSPRDESRAPVPEHGPIIGGRPRVQAGTSRHQEHPRPTRRPSRQPPTQSPPARCRSQNPRAPSGQYSRCLRRQTWGRGGRRRRP